MGNCLILFPVRAKIALVNHCRRQGRQTRLPYPSGGFPARCDMHLHNGHHAYAQEG